MFSLTPRSPAQAPSDVPEQSLFSSHHFSPESSGLSNREDAPAQPPSHPRGSAPVQSRPQDRQYNSISTVASGANIPTNPFSTPPASVISFSHGDAAATGFGDAHHRMSAQSSLANSGTELQQRRSTIPREAFASPRPRQMRLIQPSGNNSLRAKHRISTMLTGELVKPWVGKKDKSERISYFLTYSMMFIGVIGAAVRCYFAWRGVHLIGNLCPVLEDDFNGSDLDTSIWMREVDLGGFGNGEFEMATGSSNNSFIRNGQLYIVPTLTSDVIGRKAIFDGYTYNLTGCTNTNLTACGVVSNATTGTVINPVMSARISTKGKRSIRYGKVEVRAKLPKGDWLWPAIWMLPVNNTYGEWPLSGEIDLMESRGNGPTYPAQGVNYVRGSLNWGPLTWLDAVYKTFGWWTLRRTTYADGFHSYILEWTEDFLRIYVDNRLEHLLDLKFNIPFFQRGQFPTSVSNGSQEILTPNPWAGHGNAAPFDQPFYLILDVAVGGTSGWFPDQVGNKPWLNGALNAMQQFAQAQDKWSAAWPQSVDDRALRIDYVKMWELC